MSDSTSLSEIERLRIWFKSPVSKLSGDDAFVVLMISFSLFERFIKASLDERNINGKQFPVEAAKVLNIDENVFRNFWEVYRHGIQHFLQPKKHKDKGVIYGWEINSKHPNLPTYRVETSQFTTIILNPWGWFDLVFDLWEQKPELLNQLAVFPIGSIYQSID